MDAIGTKRSWSQFPLICRMSLRSPIATRSVLRGVFNKRLHLQPAEGSGGAGAPPPPAPISQPQSIPPNCSFHAPPTLIIV